MTVKAMRCPFCNREPFLERDYGGWAIGCEHFEFGDGIHEVTKWAIFDDDNMSRMPLLDGFETKRDAITSWNRYVEKMIYERELRGTDA